MSTLQERVEKILRRVGLTDAQQADEVIACVDQARAEERDREFENRPMTQNERGQWVPAIPLPFVTTWNKYRCTCRKKPFWTMDEYKQHWVYEHVYLGRPER